MIELEKTGIESHLLEEIKKECWKLSYFEHILRKDEVVSGMKWYKAQRQVTEEEEDQEHAEHKVDGLNGRSFAVIRWRQNSTTEMILCEAADPQIKYGWRQGNAVAY